jgi:hypothetical protein
VKEMVEQNNYLKEENTRLYDEWKALHGLLSDIRNSVTPRKPCPPGMSPMDLYFRKVGPTGATPKCSQ